MSRFNIILIEDDTKKIEEINNFLNSKYSNFNLVIKESYQSGLKELLNNSFDLLLLDMSIPTWDKSPSEIGQHFEKFGGYKILKELSRKNKLIKTILITMFDDFGEANESITLNQLNEALQNEFSNYYLGHVFYNAQEDQWEDNLSNILVKLKIK